MNSINNIYKFTYNTLLGFSREYIGKNNQGKKLYNWIKYTSGVSNGQTTFVKQTKLHTGTLVNAEYEITPQLNVGKLVRKEILKPDKTEIVGLGYATAASIKKGSNVRTTFRNPLPQENGLPGLLRYLELNVYKSIIDVKKFSTLLKLK